MCIFYTNNNSTNLQLELLANTVEFLNYTNDKKLYAFYVMFGILFKSYFIV